MLKAYLVYRNLEFEKIHDLRMLAQSCAKYDSEFDTLVPDVARLTPFAVRFRYPGPADPTTAEVEAALNVVETVWLFLVSRLPDEVNPQNDRE